MRRLDACQLSAFAGGRRRRSSAQNRAVGRTCLGPAPTVDQILSLKRVGSPEISPDGRSVAYTVRETNWDDNAYQTEIWLADATTGAARQLTNAKKSSQSPAWSPDGSKLAFVSDRTDKRQIYLINPQGGEAEALTSLEDGVDRFEWSPDGKTIAYTATEPKSAAVKDRDKKYGEFQVVEQDSPDDAPVCDRRRHARHAHADSGAFTVGSFSWSPDGKSIAFDHRDQPRARERRLGRHLDRHGRRRLDPQARHAGRSRRQSDLVARRFAHRVRDRRWPTRRSSTRTALIATIPAGGGMPTVLSSAFDEDPSIVAWKTSGLFFAAAAKTYAYLYQLDPESKAIARLAAPDATVDSGFSLSNDGSTIAFLGADAKSIAEVSVVSGSR